MNCIYPLLIITIYIYILPFGGPVERPRFRFVPRISEILGEPSASLERLLRETIAPEGSKKTVEAAVGRVQTSVLGSCLRCWGGQVFTFFFGGVLFFVVLSMFPSFPDNLQSSGILLFLLPVANPSWNVIIITNCLEGSIEEGWSIKCICSVRIFDDKTR